MSIVTDKVTTIDIAIEAVVAGKGYRDISVSQSYGKTGNRHQ
jgi:hypothetical protein